MAQRIVWQISCSARKCSVFSSITAAVSSLPGLNPFRKYHPLNEWMTNRHKASLQYDIKGIPLIPEIEAEIFIPFSKQDALMIDEYRLWAGLAYALNKKNEISLKFGIQQEVNVADPWRAYILGIGYSLDIN